MLQVYSANKNLPPDHKPSNNCGDFIHMLCPRVQDVLDTGEKHFWKRSDIGLRDWKVSRTWSALSICEQRQQPEQWLLSAEVIGFQDSLFKDSVSDSVEQTKVQDFKAKRSRQSHTHTRAHTHTPLRHFTKWQIANHFGAWAAQPRCFGWKWDWGTKHLSKWHILTLPQYCYPYFDRRKFGISCFEQLSLDMSEQLARIQTHSFSNRSDHLQQCDRMQQCSFCYFSSRSLASISDDVRKKKQGMAAWLNWIL